MLEKLLLSPGTAFSSFLGVKTGSDLCTTPSTIPIKRRSESTSCRRLCTSKIEQCACNCGIRPGKNDSGKQRQIRVVFIYFGREDILNF